MSRQQMIFQLSYGSAKFQTSKCKTCQEGIQSDNLVVGVKSDAMYDPMWYHFQCFWTRCWYRKQMARHLDDYTELAGYSKLTTEDKQKFREALHELTGVSGDAHGLKRRSISEENLVDIESKRSKSDVVPVANLPKLSLSATGFLSRSKENLLDGGDQSQPSEKYFNRDEEEIVVSENLAVTVKKSPEGVAVVISAKDAVNNCSTLFKMNEQQWRKMVDVFDDVTNAITSMSSSQEERGNVKHSFLSKICFLEPECSRYFFHQRLLLVLLRDREARQVAQADRLDKKAGTQAHRLAGTRMYL